MKTTALGDCGCRDGLRKDKACKQVLGKRFGKLLVLEFYKQRGQYIYFHCLCDCQNRTHVASNKLLDKKGIRSCGRCKGEHSSSFLGYGEITHGFWNLIKIGAARRDLEFNIDIEYAWNLFLKQNRKCSLSGRELFFKCNNRDKNKTASLDRVDSKKGYIEGNVQWVHKDINRMKWALSNKQFIEASNEVVKYNMDIIVKKDVPNWIEYFLGIAKVVSSRSKDAQTKVGCVITDNKNYIISTGYNSFPSGMWDYDLPTTRPEKYGYMLHAEQSAIASMRVSPHSIERGCNMYLTMPPCLTCFKLILNSNIKKLYALDVPVSKETAKDNDKFQVLLHQSTIEYNLVKPDFSFLYSVLDITKNNEATEGD